MATITKYRTKSGDTRYTAQIRIKRGGRIAFSEAKTFGRQQAAREWARRRESELRDHPDLLDGAQHRSKTLGDLIQGYIQERQEIDRLGRSKLGHLQLLARTEIAETPAMAVTSPALIRHVRERRKEGAGPSTTANDLIWFRIVMKYARSAWGIPLNPHVVDDAVETCRRERLIARPRKRNRRPTDEELRRINRWFAGKRVRSLKTPRMELIMWFAIYSARRQDEICRMRLADLDRDRGTWLIRDLKHPDGSEGHHGSMVLPARLTPVIDASVNRIHRPDGDDRLFPYRPGTVSDAWTRAMHVLGIEDLRFHDLRHEACSRLAEDGMTIPQIQEISLHESWSSLQRYVNMRPRQEARAEWIDLDGEHS